VAKIRQIKAIQYPDLQKLTADNIEQQMIEREFEMLRNKGGFDVREELFDAKNEIKELCQQIADLQYSSFSVKKERDYLQEQLQEVHQELEKSKQEIHDIKSSEKAFKDEYQTYRDNYETSQKYVKSLENEITILKNKVLRLNEIAEQFMQSPEQIENAFSVAAKGSQKAINDLNEQFLMKVEEMYTEKMKDKSTLTNLWGLNKTIEKRDDNEKLPCFAKEV